MSNDILKPLEWGFPLTLSRNTDVPKFWLKRFFAWVDRGWLYAPHPQTGLMARWSLNPDDVHSLVWWSKDYTPFIKHPRRHEIDEKYRSVYNMTITGDPSTELKVPDLEVQLDVFRQMCELYGVEKMQWRYSPAPMDLSRFGEIAEFMSQIGVRECYYSFLHSETAIPETRTVDERRELTRRMAWMLDSLGMKLLGCWDDSQFMDVAPNCGIARCVNAERIDDLYGLTRYNMKHLPETQCGCSMSVEVANQKLLPCPHACTYCYASPANQV